MGKMAKDDIPHFQIIERSLLAILGLIVILSYGGCSSLGRSRREPCIRDPGLRQELLAMEEEDQRVRQGEFPKPGSPGAAAINDLDLRHEARMRELIAEHGWPGRSLVGEDGAGAAWLLVQHTSLEFMHHCLPLLEQAAREGEAPKRHAAYLTDRVRAWEGRPQLYGTQFDIKDGRLRPYPIEDVNHLDQRRREVGLPPMKQYEKMVRRAFRGER